MWRSRTRREGIPVLGRCRQRGGRHTGVITVTQRSSASGSRHPVVETRRRRRAAARPLVGRGVPYMERLGSAGEDSGGREVAEVDNARHGSPVVRQSSAVDGKNRRPVWTGRGELRARAGEQCRHVCPTDPSGAAERWSASSGCGVGRPDRQAECRSVRAGAWVDLRERQEPNPGTPELRWDLGAT